jgi:putative heme iron utilization protein
MLQTEPAINHQIIRDTFNADRKQMTLMVARKMRVPEVEVIRSLEGDIAHELDSSRWEEIIRAFEDLGNVHVIVSNGATTLEAFGQFGKFSSTDGFFNVQTKSLDMHIRSWELASVFAFRKPSHTDGREALSFQFYDQRGESAFKVFLTFGGNDPSHELIQKYNQLLEKFKKA